MTEFLTFVIMPIVISIMCIIGALIDEHQAFTCWFMYTIAVQIMLILVYVGLRVCCHWCCHSVRNKQKANIQLNSIGNEEMELAKIPAQESVDDQTKRAQKNVEEGSKKKERAKHHFGEILTMNEDFFAFTYVSMLSHVHMLVVLFQQEVQRDIDAKKLECDAAV